MSRAAPPAAALLFIVIWTVAHPAQPVPAQADLYTHLSVARHVASGDGLVCDVVYPLSTAFPWGRQVPQPLLTRPPGPGILLVAPYLAAGRDPTATVHAVRWLQILLVALGVGLGVSGLRRRGRLDAAPAWWLLLMANPLLALGVAWGWTEITAATLLLLLWLRWRDRPAGRAGRRPAAILDGVLAGVLTLVRLELAWVPVLWWVLLHAGPGARAARGRRRLWRPAVWAALGWFLVTGPWWIRNARLTGSPLFSVQGYAVELDLDTEWWTYRGLRGLEPRPLGENLQRNWRPALVKVRHGVRFFVETGGQWLPWLVWAGAGLLTVGQVVRRRRRGRSWPAAAGLPIVLLVTLAGLVLEYGLFSQETRHLLILLPVLAWEIVLRATQALRRLRPVALRAGVLTAAVAAALLVTPPHTGGEQAGADRTHAERDALAELVAQAEQLPPGPVFTDNAAVLWLANRAGVWAPLTPAVATEIRRTVPGMNTAPWLRLEPLLPPGSVPDQ